jgi:mitochondrial fission protein ELM1
MMRTKVTENLADSCWIMTEGIPGMENQCLGLAERLGVPTRIFRLLVRAPWRWAAPHRLGSPFRHLVPGADIPVPPWPRLLIGCGRQSIPFSRAIKRASARRTITVQCQHPRVDPRAFDLVIPPEHDGLTGANVFPILGSPNRITQERLASARGEFAPRFANLRAPRLAVLIGGASKTHRFGEKEAHALAETLRGLTQTHGLMITASRRTGVNEQAILRTAMVGTDAYFWAGDGTNPYPGMLGWADAVLVTEDSVNMACEAGATGKPVHIYPLPGRGGKFAHFHESLMKRGVSRPFNGTIEHWGYVPLDETGRAANRIRTLLDEHGSASDMKVTSRAHG